MVTSHDFSADHLEIARNFCTDDCRGCLTKKHTRAKAIDVK